MSAVSSTVYAMLVACVLPYTWSVIAKIGSGFGIKENHDPRRFLSQLTGWPARSNAISMNSFESLPIFLASVLTALYMAVSPHTIEVLAWCYVGLRLTYGLAYLANLATVRSIIWTMSMASPLLLFLQAANNVVGT